MRMYCLLRNLKRFFDSTKETNGYRMDFFIEVCCFVRNLLQGKSLSVCFISMKWPFKNLSPAIISLRYELHSVKSRMQSLAAILIAQIKSYEHLADSAVTIKSTNRKFQCWKLPSLILSSPFDSAALNAYFIGNTFMSNTRIKLGKNQAIINILHPCYHSKIIENILTIV